MIKFRGVTKKYGNKAALDSVSVELPESGIYCLLGRNGAGKTTFMKTLAGHISYTSGEISVNGCIVTPANMPEGVNYIESGCVQFNTKVETLINTAAGLQSDFDRDFAFSMAERLQLNTKKKFGQLSFGMKTMLTTIISLSRNSKVVLLDEPTLGFDAVMRSQFNNLLIESYEANPRVIIISTHLIDEIAKVIERLIIIDGGKILLEAGIDEIDEKAYTLSGTADAIAPLISGLNCIGKTAVGNLVAAHIYDEWITTPDGVVTDRLSLQDFFINMVGGNGNE